jgi:cyclase
MLKKRLAACIIVKNGIAVQSIGFKKFLPIGKPEIAVEFLNNWGIDEIILIDISASKNHKGPDLEMIKRVSKKCYVPLTVGGGITNINQMRDLMHCGADKISLNQMALQKPLLIHEASKVFGDQCVIVSVDAIKIQDHHYVYDYFLGKPTDNEVHNFVKKCREYGAGEIFLNSVNEDGNRQGFDIELINKTCEVLNIPVIACGGAGKPEHFLELFKSTNASAGCAGNYFHYTEHSVTYAKSFLLKNGVDIRLDTYAHYKDFELDNHSRIAKRDDSYLEQLHYEIIPKEVI